MVSVISLLLFSIPYEQKLRNWCQNEDPKSSARAIGKKVHDLISLQQAGHLIISVFRFHPIMWIK